MAAGVHIQETMADQTLLEWLTPNTTRLIGNARSAFTDTFQVPSSQDFITLPVRLAGKLDRAIVRTIPNYILRHSGIEPWIAQVRNGLGAYAETGAAAEAVQAVGHQVAPGALSGWKALLGEAVHTGTLKSYSGMLQYLTSRWAFTCFAMALILNRVAVYGSSRQRIHLTWNKRLALRLIPVMLFIAQIHKLLQAIQCQSSPNFIDLRFGTSNVTEVASSGVEWQIQDGFLHWMSSTMLFKSSDADSCAARGMSSLGPGLKPEFGSYSLLWPTFVRLCLSHLLETISCSLQQTPVMTEIAMSIFEHSLAFAEVEISIGVLAASKVRTMTNVTEVPFSVVVLGLADATASVTGSHRLDRVNVPVEVLLVALLSCCNALSSNVISILGKQRSLRLINTGFWGCCFIASFIWAFTHDSFLMRTTDGEIEASRAVSSLLHFPTVVICGFVPHMIVLAGMGVCMMIYAIALVLTAFSLGTNPNIPQPSGLMDRFAIAHDNLQAAIQVRGINFKWHEDFYTALLRVGFTALTAASEAVFLNEGRSVEMRQFTWLEEERLDEIEGSYSGQESLRDSTFQIAEAYGVPPSLPWASSQGSVWESGYAKERKLETDKKTGMDKIGDNAIVYPHPGSGGVGAMQRTTRFYLLFIFIRGVFFLIIGYLGWMGGVCLDRIGITTRPKWLRRLVGRSGKASSTAGAVIGQDAKHAVDFWLVDRNGRPIIPTREDIDIAPELRRRLLLERATATESLLDEQIYGWWKTGGWFGTKDESSDYRPSSEDDAEDATSYISMTTTTSVSGYESDNQSDEPTWESESEGHRTPTRQSPHLISREVSLEPESDSAFNPLNLARLLNPQDKASREEARMLAAHLSNPDRITTRSTYRNELASERSRLLLAGRTAGGRGPKVSLYSTVPDKSSKQPLTPGEEAEILESLILSRRKPKAPAPIDENDNFHAQGPSCVVCQANPRTIIAWPCRCLCVCEDCRVNLALNNFGNCVTCRRQVGGFVRLYVP